MENNNFKSIDEFEDVAKICSENNSKMGLLCKQMKQDINADFDGSRTLDYIVANRGKTRNFIHQIIYALICGEPVMFSANSIGIINSTIKQIKEYGLNILNTQINEVEGLFVTTITLNNNI